MDAAKLLWELATNPKLVSYLSGEPAPAWLRFVVQPLLILLIISGVVGTIYKALSDPVRMLLEFSRRLRAAPEERALIQARRDFAEQLVQKIEDENKQEFWDPVRFADLEADHYAGNRAGTGLWSKLRAPLAFGPTRVKAVSAALTRDRTQFALLEGDPGSGKTVLLREMARRISLRATRSRRPDVPVAIYLNLKKLRKASDSPVDLSLIHGFVLEQMKSSSPRKDHAFLEKYFDEGRAQGWWLFLFDSFDEIPDVLNSEDVSDAIDDYSNAIYEFATEYKRCRTVLATRHFRRPKDSSYPNYRILPLSEKHQAAIIERAKLMPEASERLYAAVGSAGPSLRYISENPMYLGLLVDFARAGEELPQNAHDLFRRTLNKRFTLVARTLAQFGAEPAQLLAFAEEVAYKIVASSSLGLNPERGDLCEALGLSEAWHRKRTERWLDALEYLRVARGESDEGTDTRRFTFSHRRFQEYFATCYVLRNDDAVTDRELLSDARWRESAAVLLGAKEGPRLEPMLKLADQMLASAVEAVRLNDQFAESWQPSPAGSKLAPEFFGWPLGSLHLLSILQDGFAEDRARLPASISSHTAAILRSASVRGRLDDRRIALEVAGTLADEDLTAMLRTSIAVGSRVLDDVAFHQMRGLGTVPDDVSQWVLFALLKRAGRSNISREKRTLIAFLQRIRDRGRLSSAATLLCSIGPVDAWLHICSGVAIMFLPGVTWLERAGAIILLWFSNAMRPVCFWGFAQVSLAAIRIRRSRLNRSLFNIEGAFSEASLRAAQVTILAGGLLYLRFVAAMGIVISMSEFWPGLDSPPEGHWSTETIVMAYMFVVFGWAPMAVLAVAAGEFTRARYWAVLSFFPLLWVFAKPRKSLPTIGNHLKRYGLVYVVYVVLAAVVVYFDPFEYVIRSGPYAGALTVVVVYCLPAGWLSSLWISDWIRFWRAQRSVNLIAPVDFLRHTGAYFFNSFRIRFIRAVAGNQRLPDTDDAVAVVRHLNLALEREIRLDGKGEAQDTGLSTVDNWRREYTKRIHSRLRSWNTEVLDELTTLERRVVERRRSRIPEAGSSARDTGQEARRMKDFFISYNQADADWAAWIAWTLEEARYSVVIQAWDFLPGENFVLNMDAALKECRTTLLVLSEDYLRAPFPKAEWTAAFSADPTGSKRSVMPVRVRPCTPTGILATIGYIDLVGFNEVEAKDRLLSVSKGRLKPATASPFPGERVAPDQASFPAGSTRFDGAPTSAHSRLELIGQLAGLPTGMLEALIFVLKPPPGVIASATAPQSERAVQLLSWAEAPGGCGLQAVRSAVSAIIAPRS